MRDESRVFYVSVSGNNAESGGDETLPWATIQYGVDRLGPGDTLIVKSGVYEERVLFQGKQNSGALNAPILLKGEAGAIIDGINLTPQRRDALIEINSAQHIHIDGFEIRNFKTAEGFIVNSSPIGILITGNSSDIEVRDNVIHHIENNSTCHQSDNCGPSANGIAVFGNTVEGIKNIGFYENEVHSCRTSSSEAFVLNGNVDGFVVSDNYIHNNNNIGLDFIGFENTCRACNGVQNQARNGLVVRNRVINNSTRNLGGNPWYREERSAGGIYVDGGRNIIIDRNMVRGNDIGIEVSSEVPGKITSDILVTNNVVASNFEAGLALGGYSPHSTEPGGGSVTQIGVHNNTFFKNRGWGTEMSIQYRVSQSVFTNNAIFGFGDVVDNVWFSEEIDFKEVGLVWSNNLFWADGETSGDREYIQDALVKDPLFHKPDEGDFYPLPDSPLINSGVLETNNLIWRDTFWEGVFPPGGEILLNGKVDFNNKARVNHIVDIGALEKH